MIVQCPHCGSQCQVQQEWAGRHLRCPRCSQVFEVHFQAPPNVAPDLSQPMPLGPSAPLTSASSLTLAPVHRKKKKSSPALFLVIAGSVIGMFLLIGCAGIVGVVGMPFFLKAQAQASVDAKLRSEIADAPGRVDWTPEATVVGRLGPEVTFDNFAMRLPPGYAATNADPGQRPPGLPAGSIVRDWTWLGPAARHRRRVVVTAQIRQLPPGIDGNEFFERALIREIQGMRNVESVRSVEAGRIAGKRAVRVRSFMPKAPGECIEVFRFDGNRLLNLTVVVPEHDPDAHFSALWASVLTVRETVR